VRTKENTKKKTKLDAGVVPRLGAFIALSAAVSTPLRIFVEAFIEGKKGAPEFITAGFIAYGLCAELVQAMGYLVLGNRLPIKNGVLRGVSYMALILASSYLPNVLGMAGGDGKIISDSLTVGIVAVDVLSYLAKGVILGLLMKKYDLQNSAKKSSITGSKFGVMCVMNGFVFAALNILADLAAGAFNRGWKLSSILGVSSQRETVFYIVFTMFMFVAGALLPIWNKHCMDDGISVKGALLFSAKISAFVWLPNVLIMAFFGTPALLTCAYGAAYAVMIAVSVLVYRTLVKARTAQRVTG